MSVLKAATAVLSELSEEELPVYLLSPSFPAFLLYDLLLADGESANSIADLLGLGVYAAIQDWLDNPVAALDDAGVERMQQIARSLDDPAQSEVHLPVYQPELEEDLEPG